MVVADRVLPQAIEKVRQALGDDWSPEQREVVMCEAREILASGGERGGKSYTAGKYFTVRFPYPDLIWIAGKDYERCHSEFEYIAQDMKYLGAVHGEDIHTPKNGQWDMTLTLPTSKGESKRVLIKTWSLQDWLKVGSEAPDGVIICEVAQITHSEYKRLCDRTAEKRGWAIGTGTFEGSLGWYPEMWKLYQLPGQMGKSFSLPSWSNYHVYPGGRNDPEILRLEAKYSEDYFNERFGAIPSPPKGIVFPEFKYLTHVRELKIEDAPIELWIDPGYAGAYAVEVVQMMADTVRVVDEFYVQGLTTEQVADASMQKPWWNLVKSGVVDIYAMQHHAMPAISEVWLKKAGLSLIANKVDEDAGRERLHTFLTVNPIDYEPRLLVDPKCKGLLSEFGVCPNPFTDEAAPYRWKETKDSVIVGKHPEDKNNHAIKALIYGLVAKYGYAGKGGNKPHTSHSNRRKLNGR